MTLVFPASTAELPDVRRCQPCHVVLLEQQQVNKSGLLLFGKLHPANPAFEGLELLRQPVVIPSYGCIPCAVYPDDTVISDITETSLITLAHTGTPMLALLAQSTWQGESISSCMDNALLLNRLDTFLEEKVAHLPDTLYLC